MTTPGNTNPDINQTPDTISPETQGGVETPQPVPAEVPPAEIPQQDNTPVPIPEKSVTNH